MARLHTRCSLPSGRLLGNMQPVTYDSALQRKSLKVWIAERIEPPKAKSGRARRVKQGG